MFRSIPFNIIISVDNYTLRNGMEQSLVMTKQTSTIGIILVSCSARVARTYVLPSLRLSLRLAVLTRFYYTQFRIFCNKEFCLFLFPSIHFYTAMHSSNFDFLCTVVSSYFAFFCSLEWLWSFFFFFCLGYFLSNLFLLFHVESLVYLHAARIFFFFFFFC